MSPAERLRAQVVSRVLWAQIALAAGLYALIGWLLITQAADSLPDALWLAAGAAAQAIYSFLSNSKGGAEGGAPAVRAPTSGYDVGPVEPLGRAGAVVISGGGVPDGYEPPSGALT